MKTTLWIATAQHRGETLYLPDYIGVSKSEAGFKVLEKARCEGFKGGIEARLKELDWEIIEVALVPVEKYTDTTT